MNTLSRRGFLAASAATLSVAAFPSLLLPARADGHKVITAGRRVIEVKGKGPTPTWFISASQAPPAP